MDWESTAQIISAFSLTVDPDDPQAIREALRARLTALHPDRNGGSFRSPAEEAEYHRISSAINHLDRQLPVPVLLDGIHSRITAVESRLSNLVRYLDPPTPASRPTAADLTAQNASRFTPARLGSAIFAAVSGGILGLFTFLKDVPFLAELAQLPGVTPSLAAVFAGSSAMYSLTWFRERRSARRLEWLMSESGLVCLLRNTIQAATLSKDAPQEYLVSKRRLVAQILAHNRSWAWSSRSRLLRLIRRLLAPHVSHAVAEQVASTHLDELIRRDAVEDIGLRGIERVYRLTADRAKDLETDYCHTYADTDGF